MFNWFNKTVSPNETKPPKARYCSNCIHYRKDIRERCSKFITEYTGVNPDFIHPPTAVSMSIREARKQCGIVNPRYYYDKAYADE